MAPHSFSHPHAFRTRPLTTRSSASRSQKRPTLAVTFPRSDRMPFPHFVQILILAPIPLSSTVRPHTSGFTSRTPIYFFFRFSPHIDTLASYSHTHPYPHYATFATYNLLLPQEQLPTLAPHLLSTYFTLFAFPHSFSSPLRSLHPTPSSPPTNTWPTNSHLLP